VECQTFGLGKHRTFQWDEHSDKENGQNDKFVFGEKNWFITLHKILLMLTKIRVLVNKEWFVK
jgi:hypothetical protein